MKDNAFENVLIECMEMMRQKNVRNARKAVCNVLVYLIVNLAKVVILLLAQDVVDFLAILIVKCVPMLILSVFNVRKDSI